MPAKKKTSAKKAEPASQPESKLPAWAGKLPLILIVVGTIRELFGSGSLLGYQILPLATEGGWYEANGMMLLPPSAFFIIGIFIWILRSKKTEQVEHPDYQIHEVHRTEVV